MNKTLEAIRKRPDNFLSRFDRNFTCLEGFLSGYQAGFAAAKYGHEATGHLVPQDFSKFVAEKFGERLGAKGAGAFIVENTSSERQAFDLFFTLLDEYDQKQSGK